MASRTSFAVLLTALMIIASSDSLAKDAAAGQASFEGLGDEDSIRGNVARANRAIEAPLLGETDRPFYDAVQRFKRRLHDATRIDFALDYNTIAAFATTPEKPNDVWIGQTTATVIWRPYGDELSDTGVFGVRFRRRNNIVARGPDFTDAVGTIWAPVNMSSRNFTRINEMAWGQRFGEGSAGYILGLLDVGSYIDTNRYASSVSSRFFSQAHNSNPARSFPSNGITIYAEADIAEIGQVRVAIADGTADTSHPFRTIDDGHWFWAIEALTDLEILGQRGIYRATVWGRQTASATGQSFTLSFDQDLGERQALFLRYGHGDHALTEIRDHLSVGGILRQPFGRAPDAFGLSASWSSPYAQTLRDEYALEAFYRVQLLYNVEVSGSLQLIFKPTESARSADAVFGLRLRALY